MTQRIALVTHDFRNSGGVGAMTKFLYRALRDTGSFEPEVISLAMSSSDSASVQLRSPASWFRGIRWETCNRQGIPFRHVGARLCEFEFQRYKPRLELTNLLNGYDLIQFVVGTPPWLCAALRARPPKFLWIATMIRADRNNRLKAMKGPRRIWMELMTRIAERYERESIKNATAVFALSEYSVKAARHVLGDKGGRLATCGVDTELFRPDDRPRKYILCVGRLDDPRKNVGLLLQAYAAVCSKMPDAPELWLAGAVISLEITETTKRLGVFEKVRVLGRKSPAELAELYRGALLFALSSDEEGLGIVLLEAMASGTPVISTACGGPETVVKEGETGLLTPVGDAEALGAAMRRLVTEPALRARMGQRARKDAEERFSIAAAAKPFVEEYECCEKPLKRLQEFEAAPTPN